MNYSRHSRVTIFVGVIILLLSLVLSGTYLLLRHLNTPPENFPLETDILVPEGLALHSITKLFEEHNAVRSSILLYTELLRASDAPVIQAGMYRFPKPLTTQEIATALVHGSYQAPLVRVTFPEGFKAEDIRSYYPPSYAPKEEGNVTQYEGYLFPDTYHITGTMSEDALVALMRATFEKKIKPYTEAIQTSGFSRNDIIILASIIEREAKDTSSKKHVSGILHNRLKLGMPLQVDATLDYLLNKTSAELTADDLKIDSPFNTYIHKGLPPSPIANPGLDAIEAAINPLTTKDLYYLTAPDGTFYYAQTFEQHKKNKQKYLP